MAKYRVYIRRRSTHGAHDSGPFARFDSMEIQMKQSFKKNKYFSKSLQIATYTVLAYILDGWDSSLENLDRICRKLTNFKPIWLH